MGKSLSSLIKIIRYFRDNEVKLSNKLLFLVPVIYLLFPFDLIGDFFPLAGQLDDAAVFIVMWPILKKLLTNYNPVSNSRSSQHKKDRNTIDIDEDDYEFK